MSEAEASKRGSAVRSPGASVSSTTRSAPMSWATSAARRSLSPKRISSSAMASFSLTIGTTPSSSNRSNVPRACRYWLRTTKSSGASSTWPLTIPWPSSRRSYTRISRLWPTADRACRVTASLGRLSPPRPMAGNPAAMAPEVTATTRWPAVRSSATSAQNLAMAGLVDVAVVVGDRRGADLGDDDLRPTGHARGRLSSRGGLAVGFVVEGEASDAHLVALLGAGSSQRLGRRPAGRAAPGRSPALRSG